MLKSQLWNRVLETSFSTKRKIGWCNSLEKNRIFLYRQILQWSITLIKYQIWYGGLTFNNYNYGTVSVMNTLCCEYNSIVFLDHCIISGHTLMILLATHLFYKSAGNLTRWEKKVSLSLDLYMLSYIHCCAVLNNLLIDLWYVLCKIFLMFLCALHVSLTLKKIVKIWEEFQKLNSAPKKSNITCLFFDKFIYTYSFPILHPQGSKGNINSLHHVSTEKQEKKKRDKNFQCISILQVSPQSFSLKTSQVIHNLHSHREKLWKN